jgi:amino acid adenylation domain-containing protein/non-ribosomal peptide synthase protein (TIGR01720 family)
MVSPQARATTWPERFAAHVRAAPDAVAVVFEDESLTYAELDTRANRLANRLVAAGAGPERFVALAVPRSLDMIIAEVAVLKSGAAYLPVDIDYPLDRVSYMLRDARPVCLVTTGDLVAQLPGEVPLVVLDSLGDWPADPPSGPVDVHNAAYVIYTSGSTGRPKGVVLSHTGVAKLVATQTERFGIGSGDRILQFASPSFDVAFWDLCLALLSGGQLIVVPAERRVPGPELISYIERHKASFMILPPSLLAVLPGELALPPGATLLAGTERVSPELVARYGRDRRMFNAYGPTEATVNSTLGESHPDRVHGPVVPIGIADPMTVAHVLDYSLRPVEEGELYLGGPGLARGYLNRPGLTAERFVADPFGEPGGRLYRTGDLVRTNSAGALEFLGRVDDQVKIRGYRIEPGEIESVLLAHESVTAAAVLAREDKAGQRLLVAYVEPDPGAGGKHGYASLMKSLRGHVAAVLPDYMVPAAFVPVERLPVMANGKLDRAALPAPDFAALAGSGVPRTPVERQLCGLVAEVLGLPQTGVDDDFFALGGDSIVSIQLVIRAREEGLKLTPRAVFEHRTPAALARVVTAVEVREEASGVGTFPMTPIMRWLDECGGPVKPFSQAMLVAVPAEAGLVPILQAVLDKHDLLRARIDRGARTFTVAAPGSVDAASILSTVSGNDIESLTREAAGRLDPERGVMIQAVRCAAGLLLVVHHWVVDGVSWRILVPDLAAAAQGALAPAGTPFGPWSELLHKDSEARSSELPLWTSILDGTDPLLTQRVLDPVGDLGSVRRMTLRLPADRTTPLLTTVPAAFHAGINDVLLTALALAVAEWRGGGTEVLVALEGHGREEQIGDVDLSRTLGWFTSIFPVRLDPGPVDRVQALAGGADAGTALKRIKEQLRAIPDHGIGYGLLRHLNPETARVLARYPKPQISFNYLGRFTVATGQDWTALPGAGVLEGGFDTAMPVAPYSLEINAFTADGPDGPELGVTWAFPAGLFAEESVRTLAEGWFAALAGLVTHAAGPGAGGHTPSDLGLLSLSQEEIDELEAEWEIS